MTLHVDKNSLNVLESWLSSIENTKHSPIIKEIRSDLEKYLKTGFNDGPQAINQLHYLQKKWEDLTKNDPDLSLSDIIDDVASAILEQHSLPNKAPSPINTPIQPDSLATQDTTFSPTLITQIQELCSNQESASTDEEREIIAELLRTSVSLNSLTATLPLVFFSRELYELRLQHTLLYLKELLALLKRTKEKNHPY